MPVIITKRVLHTFTGGVVLVIFAYGAQQFDYIFDLGRDFMTDEQALHRMERSGFMDQARTLFLTEVDLGRTPHDVEITTKETAA